MKNNNLNKLFSYHNSDEIPSDKFEQLALDGMGSISNENHWKISTDKHTLVATNHGALNYQSADVNASIIGNPYISDVNTEKGGLLGYIVEQYRKYGEQSFARIKGDFVLIISDIQHRQLFVVLDKIGQRQLYYYHKDNYIILSTKAKLLASHSACPKVYSSDAIYNYFYFHCIPTPYCIFQDIHKLSGGQYLRLSKDGLHVSYYWSPDFTEHDQFDVPVESQKLKELVQDSVHRLSEREKVGAFLSGGLDSSTVSGMLATCHPGNANTFSIGFEEEGYNEIEYARKAVAAFKTKQHEFFVTPEITARTIPLIIEGFDEPFGNSSALPTYFCANLASENNISRLLAGDGGDEIFAGNERYRKQKVFETYYRIPNIIRSLALKPLPKISLLQNIPYLSKICRYVEQAEVPLPDRLESYNFLHRHHPAEMFSDNFLNAINCDIPINILREWYSIPANANYIDRMLYLDWNRTLHDNDLVKVNQMCELAGVEVVYPLLDDNIIEMSCRIPANIKLKNNTLRWFFKESFKDFLPNDIINKSKHGFGLPFGIWTDTNDTLKSIAYDSLQDFKKRDILKPEFIDDAIKFHSSIHSSYYGELVWIIMMLELWLKNEEN